MEEAENVESARIARVESSIRETIDNLFQEKWDLMNRRVASLWKETTKDVLQVHSFSLVQRVTAVYLYKNK